MGSDERTSGAGTHTVAATRLSALVPAHAHHTLGRRALATMHEAILTGVLVPGERPPNESLAQTLGISSSPIRETLGQACSVGLGENFPHRGARVTEMSVADLREGWPYK